MIKDVGINPTRDGILRVCKAMGADITLLNKRTAAGEPVADLLVRHSELHGTVIEGELIPTLIDEIPVLAVLAAYARWNYGDSKCGRTEGEGIEPTGYYGEQSWELWDVISRVQMMV